MNGGTKRSSAAAAATKQFGILFNKNFNFQIHKVFSDPNGRFLICDIVAESRRLTVANIYATNEDDPNFFQVFFDHLSNFKREEIITGGDKRRGFARTQKNTLKVIRDFSENLGLTDIWRLFNPEARRYTSRPTCYTLPNHLYTPYSKMATILVFFCSLAN